MGVGGGVGSCLRRNDGKGAQALEYGLATQSELEALSAGWLRWSGEAEALFEFVQIGVVASR